MATSLLRCPFALAIALAAVSSCAHAPAAAPPASPAAQYRLPNGWSLSPVGTHVDTEDLVLNIVEAPDGRAVVALTSGYNPHGLVLIDTRTDEPVQRVGLETSWLGLAWHPRGDRLYVSGGNRLKTRAPVLVFGYEAGRLTYEPVAEFLDETAPAMTFWAGLAHHPARDVLYAANRSANEVVAFDSLTGRVVGRVATGVNPYDLVMNADGSRLYISNWASDSVSVIDTATLEVVATVPVGDNPNDLALVADGRLFVACSNDNTVVVVDTAERRTTETIVTAMFPKAPVGSTPNALALSPDGRTLYVANADNNNVAVIDVAERGASVVLGFLPAGWYPSALAAGRDGRKLYVGNSKGTHSYPTKGGVTGPAPPRWQLSVKSATKGTVQIVDVAAERGRLRELTRQVYANTPYSDALLERAVTSPHRSVVPERVGEGSAIEHVIYIIKENRTYDSVFGALPQGNGDAGLCTFGRDITPNHHAIAEQWVLFDNLMCEAEVSRDGHQWSNAAYATDFVEKNWPANYAGLSAYANTEALLPSSGYLWDQALKKGLTVRSYGEAARRVSEDEPMAAHVAVGGGGLAGNVAPGYLGWGARDYENAAEFIREFDEYERNFDSADPATRLPNFIVMSLPEDHTKGAAPGAPTMRAAVASNDYALGLIVERVSRSRYWPTLAVFVIEDDAQDSPDHVDGRRTVGLVASPYARRGIVDSTFYTTCSMLRTIELLLGLPPMAQCDAAATPMYAAFSDAPDLRPFTHLPPRIDIHELNTPQAWGAQRSLELDFSSFDLVPTLELAEIIWRNAKGSGVPMPPPVRRFHPGSLRGTGGPAGAAAGR